MASGTDSSIGMEKALGSVRSTNASNGSTRAGPATATAAPAATQRSCWRSTPRESRNRSTTETAAAGMQANSTAKPAQLTTAAAEPAQPCNANGLATGTRVWVIGSGDRHSPTAVAAVPATHATRTGRQRGKRRRPSGSSSSGKVTARVIPTAQRLSPARAASRAAGGRGRPLTSRWSTQGSRGQRRSRRGRRPRTASRSGSRAGVGSGPARRWRTAATWRRRRRRRPAGRRSAAGSPAASPPARRSGRRTCPATATRRAGPARSAHPTASREGPAVRERYGPARRAAWLT
jgi:hypothetical protein